MRKYHAPLFGLALLAGCGGSGDTNLPSGQTPSFGDRGSATWRVDSSGYDYMPNPVFRSPEELSERNSRGSTGALFDPSWGAVVIGFEFEGDDVQFRLPSVTPGTYDLSGNDGVMEVGGRYSTATQGGFGLLVLEQPEPGTLVGTFQGRYCFEDTPGANCFNFYLGRFEVEDLATGVVPSTPAVDFGVPADFPQLDASTLQRATWRRDGSAVVEGRARAMPWSIDGATNLDFEVAPGPQSDGYRVSLKLVSVMPGPQQFTEYGARMTLSVPGQTWLYTTKIEGGGGGVEIIGASAHAIWGYFGGRVCFARTPNANCYEFTEGRFSAAIP